MTVAIHQRLKPTSTETVLNQQFLDIRCRILDLAAQLDRLDRGGGAGQLASDARWNLIQKGLALLTSSQPAKAQALQELFSIPYDPNWEKPSPRF